MSGAAFIIEARRRAGLTQAGLAERLGVPRQSISRWERGSSSVTVDRLEEIVRACGLDLHLSLERLDDSYVTLLEDARRRTPTERLDALLTMQDLRDATTEEG